MITKEDFSKMNMDQKIKSVLKLIDKAWGHDYPDWLDEDTNLCEIPQPDKELYFYESNSFTTDDIDKAIVQTKKVVKLVNSCEKQFVIDSIGYTLYSYDIEENTKIKYILGICTTNYLGESISFEGVKNFYKRVKLRRPIIKDLPLATYLTNSNNSAPCIDTTDWSLYGDCGDEIIMLADRVRRFKMPKI